MPAFEPGHPKIPGSGRKKGQVGIRTQLAREGLRSAIEICREGGDDPITIMMRASRLLNTVAAAFAPQSMSTDQEAIKAAIKAVPRSELDLMRRFLVDACDIAAKAAEFGYAKLARIDYVGDQPSGPARVENKFEFVLNIDAAHPGRPVSDDDNVIEHQPSES